jgi:multiple sugar transport system ATP-binding protein
MGDRIAVMKDGVLQQVGTPQELYDNPVNVFVAGFIGSPAMNFATVKTTEGEDLMLGGSKLVLSGRAARAAADRPKGADLLIGFRPEHLDVADGRSDVMKIPARVDVVEYLGNEELIHAQAEDDTEIVALIPSERKVKPGEQVELGVPLDKLHVFDPETEQSLIEAGQN